MTNPDPHQSASASGPGEHEGRVALVTGCGRRQGMGAAIARRLAADGARVAVVDVVATGLRGSDVELGEEERAWAGIDDLVAEIGEHGGKAIALTGDVSSEDDAVRLVEEAVAALGGLDILVNNAGAGRSLYLRSLEEMSGADWDAVMAVNARSAFLMSKAASLQMRKAGWGRIVSVASVAAKVGGDRISSYAASKAAVMGLSRALAVELAPHGITSNAICPGRVLTSKMMDTLRSAPAGAGAVPTTGLLGRMGQPEEVGALVSFLASEGAGFITGQAINVDGGELAS